MHDERSRVLRRSLQPRGLGVDEPEARFDLFEAFLDTVEPRALVGEDLEHGALCRGDFVDLDLERADVAANEAEMLEDEVGGVVSSRAA